jgi:hypothetical protein
MDIKEELAQLRKENRMLRVQVAALRGQIGFLEQRIEDFARRGEPVPAFVKANKPKPSGPKAPAAEADELTSGPMCDMLQTRRHYAIG